MSVVLNTKIELFMGKRRFTAKKLSKKEFEKRVVELFDNLLAQYPDYFEEYFECNEKDDSENGVECLFDIGIFAEDMRAEDELPEELSMLCADMDCLLYTSLVNTEEGCKKIRVIPLTVS